MSRHLTALQLERIADLCRRNRNEDRHTEHVTALALRVFDAVQRRLNLPAASRPLLEAAARLHDIGFARDPAHHAVAGARIVLAECRGAWPDADLKRIAAIMLLHTGPIDAALGLATVRACGADPWVVRLGAILRVADALDHGHVQDARIAGFSSTASGCVATIRSPWVPENRAYAEAKADLWQRVMPVPLRFTATRGSRRDPALLTPDLCPLEAVRRLLLMERCALLDHVPGALGGSDPEHLHDIRTALRRIRILLRDFRAHLRGTPADALHDLAARLRREVGDARDMDVRLALLQRREVARAGQEHARWAPFIEAQRRERAVLQRKVRRVLASRDWARLRHGLGMLARIEIPGSAERRTGPLSALAEDAVHKAIKRVAKRSSLAKATKAAALHRFRIELRKVRHRLQLFEPVLPGNLASDVESWCETERSLGKVHDLDLALAAIAGSPVRPPRGVIDALKKRRRRQLHTFRRGWKRLRRS